MKSIKFDSLELSEQTLRGIEEMGFEEASPIQAKSIPSILLGRDIIGQAQTGTGKTAAFGIPALEKINPQNRAMQCMVLCPTRELAIQVAGELNTLGRHHQGLVVLPVYGGQPIERQIKALRQGAQIVIGTPGRIMDHMSRKTLKLDQVRMVVLDEADEMLDMGFRDDIEYILGTVTQKPQTIFFSATMAPEIMRLAERFQDSPELVRISHKRLTVPGIEQFFFEVHKSNRLEAMSRIIDFYNPKLCIVFCNTKRGVDQIVQHLQIRGYLAEGLHGDMNQNQRDRVMAKFRSGQAEIMVATDVAARGIDVDDIEAVFNYDIPNDVEYYVHRIGRTGRAGRTGMAFTFVSGREMYKIRDIQRFTKSKIIQRRVPSIGDVEQARTEKFLGLIKETITKGGLEKYLRLVENFTEKEEDSSSVELAAALLKMLMGPGEDKAPVQDIPTSEDTGSHQGMIRLVISIGRADDIAVKDVVGAIAGETGLPGRLIGKVEIRQRQSFVQVPEEYASNVLSTMNNNQIRGKRITVEIAGPRDDFQPGQRQKNKKPSFGKVRSARTARKSR
ncbi:DEAD/DEAH box helicase [Desulfonatronovibrio hydrogenovorans]|uniref:DEAD/DEAH box helicase n=1 Tax=Desulfonatronovibrio hydrogenovorans TaxID=53245 RepID=UPI000A048E3E|nr:DEAD/DEAH box helicase [Desulfonatronovibrio hydrogenovorans]